MQTMQPGIEPRPLISEAADIAPKGGPHQDQPNADENETHLVINVVVRSP
jgi:hypothetical protein